MSHDCQHIVFNYDFLLLYTSLQVVSFKSCKHIFFCVSSSSSFSLFALSRDSCVHLRLIAVASSTPFRYLLVLRFGRSDRRTVLVVADVCFAGVGHSRMGFHPPCSIAKIGFAQRNACSAFNLRHINIRTKGLECSLGSPAVDRLLGLVFLSFIQKKLIIRVSHMHAHTHVPRLLLNVIT